MTNDRLRSPVKIDYVEALGRAAYTFATLEWQVVWCAGRISPGFINKVVDQEMTAGTIANKFFNLTRNMPRAPEREELMALASRFRELVSVRNNIFHGKPCTGPNGEPRLSGNNVIEIPDLENAADVFVECSSGLNTLFYGFLQTFEASGNT